MTDFSFRTIGFDLDGTLIDTIDDLAAATNHALVGLGRSPLSVEQMRPMIGGGGRHLLTQAAAVSSALDEVGLDAGYAALLAHYAAHIADLSRPFPQVIKALDALLERGITLAVVTNKQERLAHELLSTLGLLDRFATVIGGDTLGPGRGKPKPDLLLEMLKRCGGPAAFVGDSIYDVEAAHAAGLPVIACSFGYRHQPVEALGADAVIDNYAELLPALVRLGR